MILYSYKCEVRGLLHLALGPIIISEVLIILTLLTTYNMINHIYDI